MPRRRKAEAPAADKVSGRLNIDMGNLKADLKAAASDMDTTQTQLLKDALKTYLLLRAHATDRRITLVGKDGRSIEVML